MSTPTIHDIVGCLVIGSWTNLCLYGVECCFVLSYFFKYKNDQTWIKVLVAAAWLNDTLATTFSLLSVYRYTVIGFGNMSGLLEPGWEFVGAAAT
jgi:hypothetical protein